MAAPPRYSTSIVGRDRPAAALAKALDRSGGLWTLVGPGGVGKTRLASSVSTDWAGARWWVDLQAVRDVPGLIRALSHGMDLGPESDPIRVLAERGRALVVLDNFEQIVHSCAGVVDEWLRSAPSLRVIATSREPLKLGAERLVEVQPLIAREAADVFLAAAPFVFEGESADPAVLEGVLEVLEGLPLALELAAARLDVMTLDQLRDRLVDPLAVLQDPSRSKTRHGGLQAAIAWSWDLLGPGERSVLGQCAVFRGGFTLEAAEAIVVVDGPVVDAIHRLRQQRLLTFDGGRFGMLEVIRHFAASVSELEAVGLRHGAYYASLAVTLSEKVGTADVREALDGLSAEYDNLRAVLEGASVDHAIDAGAALGAVLEHRGPVQAQIPVINRVLELCPDDPEARARFLRQRAFYLEKRGRIEEAKADLETALEGVEAIPLAAARVRVRLGDLYTFRGDSDRAREAYERALPDTVSDPDLQASVVIQLSVDAHDNMRPDDARRLEAEALALARKGGNPFRVAKVLGIIGSLATETLEHERARSHLEEALGLFESLNIPRSVAFTTGNLGLLAEVAGNHDEAEARYSHAVEGARAARDERLIGIYLGFLGRLHIRMGRSDEGRGQLLEAVEVLEAAKAPRMIGVFRSNLAVLAAEGKDPELAQRHLDQIDPDDKMSVDLAEVAVQVAHCLAASAAGDDASAAKYLKAAESGLDEGRGPADDIKTQEMVRLVELARADTAAWVIATDGTWFRPPGGDRVEVRGAQALVLAKLLRMHRVDDAQVEDLAGAGWPEERISEAAATNRVYVALTGLRKLGIRPILVGARPGWRLDPEVPLRKA